VNSVSNMGETKKTKRVRQEDDDTGEWEAKRVKVNGNPEEGPNEPLSRAQWQSLEYLKSWKLHRETWRFQKARQSWLLRNMYNKSSVTSEMFKLLLEYLVGLQGNRIKTLIEEAENEILVLKKEKEQQSSAILPGKEQNEEIVEHEKRVKLRRAKKIRRVLRSRVNV